MSKQAKSLVGLKNYLLGFPFAYNSFQAVVGKFGRSKLELLSKYVPYTPGTTTLDLGCGPGTSAKIFNPNDYVGIDCDSGYISYAQRRNPEYSFYIQDFCSLSSENSIVPNGGFDLILASGLMHHLEKDVARQFFLQAEKLLANGGHFITIDPCIHSEQSNIKKRIILSDRGKFVRTPNELIDIASGAARLSIIKSIEENCLLIPYTHVILTCKKH